MHKFFYSALFHDEQGEMQGKHGIVEFHEKRSGITGLEGVIEQVEKQHTGLTLEQFLAYNYLGYDEEV